VAKSAFLPLRSRHCKKKEFLRKWLPYWRFGYTVEKYLDKNIIEFYTKKNVVLQKQVHLTLLRNTQNYILEEK
jgi:hypothetical protein